MTGKLLAFVLAVALCFASLPALAAGEGVTVVDMTGREITLEAPATRVVALTASDCEILYAVGAGDCLVGRGTYCDHPAEVLEIPAVNSGAETNVEEIIALEPQIVLMGTMAQSEEQVAALEKAGVKVVVSDAQDIEGVYEAIALIGALMGKDKEAAALNEEMQTAFADIADKGVVNAGKTVYFEVSPLEYGLWTAGTGTFMNELAEMCGLTNVFADVEGWASVSEEQVIERDPDYIVTITMYYGEGPLPTDEIKARVGWEKMKAVVNGHVFDVNNDELSRPGPRLMYAAQALLDLVSEEESDKAA